MSLQPVRKEVQELQFKLLTQIKLFSSPQSLKLDNPTSLVATASKFGLIFVGIPSGFTCFFTSTIINIQKQRANNRGYITSFPRRDIKLNGTPSHIAVSSDNEQLAIAVVIDTCPILLIYNVNTFGTMQIKTKCEIRMGNTPGVTVADIQWNPGVANVISAAMSDGSAYVYEIKDSTPTISSIPQNSQASCICWSPKGKQIVIGAKNGSLTQYKPDLKAVKTFPPPAGLFNQPEVVSVQWLSNYQFIATYKDKADPSSKPAVMIVNAPKSAPPSFVNHEDICYGFGTNRPEHYFIHQQQWCIIIIGNTNSTEIAVLGQNNDSWDQWLQDESNRAQLPVSEDYQDVYLTGLAIDYSPQITIPIGENSFLNPMPLLLMYSQEGVLCFFHIINLVPNACPLCHAPILLPDQSGIHLFTDVPQVEKNISNSRAEESGQMKPFGSEISKQPENAFKLSLGSNVSFGPVKEAAPQTTQSPFAALNMQKSNTFAPNAGLGQAPAFGFGMAMDNKTTIPNKGFFSAPKFSTSTPIVSQQSSAVPTNISFNMPPITPQVVTSIPQESSSNSILQQQQQQQQHLQQQSKGLSSMFQAPNTVVTSTPTSFFSTKTAETSEVNQGQPRLALLATPNQINQQLIIPQVTPVAAKQILEKEPKDPAPTLSTATSGVMPQMKDESEVSQLNQVTTANDEEKEESFEVDFIGPIKEKVADFNAEILNLQKFKNRLNFYIDNGIINDVVTKINELKTFEKDLRETTSAQEAEVTGLINNVLEMFSWLENVKSKQKQINNPKYLDLMESQGLDPMLKKNMQNIEQYFYYLETQIKQAKIQLDSLWSKHKDKPQKALELPNMEAIYQTIVAENYILAAQKVRVTELEVRLKEKLKSLTRKVPKISDFSSLSSLKSSSNGDLDVLADKLLLFKIGQSDTHANKMKSGFEENIITSSSQKYLNQKKELLIHKWHKNHVVINTKPNKRQQTTEICLTQYPKQSINSSISSNLKNEEKQVGTAKSIFTLSKPATYSSQISNGSEKEINLKDKNTETVVTSSSIVLINQKPEAPITFAQSKHEVTPAIADKSCGDTLDKFASNLQQVSYSNNVNYNPNQPLQSTKSGVITSTISTSSVRLPINTSLTESNLKNNFTNPELKIATKDLNAPSENQESDKTLQPNVTVFESNFFSKAITTTPPTFLNPSAVTTTTDVQPKNITPAVMSPEVALSSSMTEIKDVSKKENVEIVPDAGKDISSENTKVNTSFLFSGMSFVSTPGNVTVTSTVSATNPPSINIFGNSPLSGQNTLGTLNFSKSPIFSNINTSQTNTTPVKTTSIFGAPIVSGNTAASPTPSIFGGKPLSGSPTFVTSLTPTTTSNITPVPSKPATTTTAFFCKPSSMKSLFANSQMPTTNAAATTIFKTTPSTLGTSIFASAQPQQVSASTAPQTSLVQTNTSVSPSPNVPATPANSTPVTTLTSCGISSTPASLTFTPPPAVTSTIESNTTNISPAQSESSNVAAATTSLITSSTDTTSASVTTIEKEPATTSSTFGISSTVPSIFGAKSGEQSVPVFSTTGPSSPSNTFGKTVTTAAGFTNLIPTETSIFAAAASKPSIFGNQNPTITFGGGTPTTTSSIFSTATSPTFGGTPPSTTKTTTPPLFGTPATFGTPTTSNASVFGAAAALSSTSFFGNTPATTSSAFGTTPTASPFSSTPATTSTSFFGQQVCSPTSTATNVFSSISFAQKTTPVTTAGSIFGGNRSSFEAKPLFQSGGVFGQPASTPGSFGTSGGSLFGGKSTFGTPQQQPNLFQSTTGTSGNLFSSGNTSGGSFSTGGNQSVAQSGFGAVPNFQNAAKPFGNTSPTAFGNQSSGFGSAPTFGGSATFGSPNKMFGSLSPGTSAFGSPTQQSSTFENLAGQNTLTFGNLAQGQPNFNSSPSFGAPQQQQQTTFPTTSSFGGSSFSTWR